MYTLLIGRNDIIKNSFLKGSIDVDQLITFIRPAQDKYIINILGSSLLNKLMYDVGTGNTMTDIYNELWGHTKRCLLWYVVAEYLPFSSIQFKSDGAYMINNEQFTTPSRGDIEYLLIKALDNAEMYSKRLQKFLIANMNLIPEYNISSSKSDTIYPDGSNQYFSGIN